MQKGSCSGKVCDMKSEREPASSVDAVHTRRLLVFKISAAAAALSATSLVGKAEAATRTFFPHRDLEDRGYQRVVTDGDPSPPTGDPSGHGRGPGKDDLAAAEDWRDS